MAIQSAKNWGTDKTATWIEDQAAPFPVLLDPEGSYVESLGLPAEPYPLAYLLNAEGRIVWVGAPQNRKRFADAFVSQMRRLMRGTKRKAAGGARSAR